MASLSPLLPDRPALPEEVASVHSLVMAAFPDLATLDPAMERYIPAFLAAGRVHEVEAGIEVCSPGQSMPGMFVVLDGILRLEKDGHPIRDFSNGEYFGEGSLIRDYAPGVSIRTCGPTRLFLLPRPDSERFMETHPDFGFAFLRILLGEAMARLQATNKLYSDNRALAEKLEQTVRQLEREITERRQAEDRNRYLVAHDPLTELSNRVMFQERLEIALTQAERYKHNFAVLLLDLDEFKTINDLHSHAVGDLVLRQVAERINTVIRGVDAAARLGGDEFAVLQDMSHLGPSDSPSIAAARLAERLIEALAQPILTGQQRLEIQASVGIVLFPDDGASGDELLRNADMALYRSKSEGRGRFCLFTPDMGREVLHISRLKAELRLAIEDGNLEAFYQPKISLLTGEIMGMEALVRWRHPTRGLIGPADFITIAEQHGLMPAIGEWVMREACLQTRLWHEQAGLPGLKVAVNLSPVQFRHQNVPAMVENALAYSSLLPGALEIEVTENVLIHNTDQVLAALARLREMGVSIAVDDFGTGFSSLSYLKQFSAHTVKIDRAFIRNCHTDTGDQLIARAIISLAHSLGMKVVGEGIELPEHVDFLRQARCDQAQGFLFAKPMPAPAFSEYMENSLVREVRAVVKGGLEYP